jgi:hypothetical protein
MDGTTWPWRHPCGRFLLMKQLISGAEKSPQNFRVGQSPLQQSTDNLQQGLQPVEASPSHTKLLVGMGDSTTTRKRREWCVGVVPQ